MFDHPDDESIVLLEEDWISIALAEVCKALQYLHASGWVHRDVRASNIVLNSDGHIKLADYQTVAVEKPEVPAGESMCVPALNASECQKKKKILLNARKPSQSLGNGLSTVALTRFGWCEQCVYGRPRRLHDFAGSPCWMAPEVMVQAPEGYAPDPVDTWSLGITVLELCMGYAPYVRF